MHSLNKNDSCLPTLNALIGKMNIFFFFMTGLKNKRRAIGNSIARTNRKEKDKIHTKQLLVK